MKRFAKHWADEMPEHPQGHWVRYDDARAVIDGLQALLNERDEKLAVYESFPGYLIDHCEGATVFEENLQHWLAAHIRALKAEQP